MLPQEHRRPRKLCFVTIGATASFDSLVSAALAPDFLNALRSAGYTDLLVQFGKGGRHLFERCKRLQNQENPGDDFLRIEGFDFSKQGLGQEMKAAKGEDGGLEGVVISHAGSGSILDALRLDVPLIVVPNPDLLDNHQVELAEELAAQGYVVHSKLRVLGTAILESEKLRRDRNSWFPINSGAQSRLVGVMDEEMGFLD